VVKTFSGTIAIYSTALGDTGFGTAGLTETSAREEDIDCISGTFEGVDHHPGKSAQELISNSLKLIAAEPSGIIIGGEVIGGLSAGELTNVIGLAIQNRMSINSSADITNRYSSSAHSIAGRLSRSSRQPKSLPEN
jgi:NADH oxidase (H2O2-forming)